MNQARYYVADPAGSGNYPLNCWYVVATSDEVGRSLLARQVLGRQLLAFRQEGGQVAVLAYGLRAIVHMIQQHRCAGGARIGAVGRGLCAVVAADLDNLAGAIDEVAEGGFKVDPFVAAKICRP